MSRLDVKELEIVCKGFASRRRLQILEILYTSPVLSLSEIADSLKTDEKNASQHLAKVVQGGLATKSYSGGRLAVELTARGKSVFEFVRKL